MKRNRITAASLKAIQNSKKKNLQFPVLFFLLHHWQPEIRFIFQALKTRMVLSMEQHRPWDKYYGIYFGKPKQGCIIIWQLWNHGSWKINHFEEDSRRPGNKRDYVRTFDVSGENILLCKILGGTVIKMDGTNDTALNPLEILKSGLNDNESYTRHISKLKTMYLSLKPTAESTELSNLSAVMDEIYQKFDLKPGSVRGITGRAAEEYPIFSDVHEYIEEKINEMSQKEYSEIELDLAKASSTIIIKYRYGYM